MCIPGNQLKAMTGENYSQEHFNSLASADQITAEALDFS
jgi:hypothetical protein